MTHSAYQENLSNELKKWQKRKSRALSDDWLAALLRLNLDPINADLQILYATAQRGRPAYDPICMLRALLLMTMLRFSSIPKFGLQLRRKPRLATMAGFPPDQVPAVGTFYLFIGRLENGPYQPKCP